MRSLGPYKHDSSYQHDSFAPAIIYLTLYKSRIKWNHLSLVRSTYEDVVETTEGMKSLQDYGDFWREIGWLVRSTFKRNF